MLALADNVLNIDSDESDPDSMAAEYFKKLQNQELPQVEIERGEDYDTFLRELLQQARLSSKITYSPALDSQYSSDKEYNDNEVCSEDERVNEFHCDNEEQAPFFVISIEEEDNPVNKFRKWLKSTDGGKTSCDAEKRRLVLMSIVRFDQE